MAVRVATITCHDVYNFGASLQAFSLQRYLESKGHEVEIIDYKPDYLNRHYSLSHIENPKYDLPIIKQLYLIAKFPGRLLNRKRKRAFDKFTLKYLKLTRRYYSSKEIQLDPPSADTYIAGSDQIWNTLFKNGHDPAFYLDFVRKGWRLSYAASFATDRIYGGEESNIKKWLSSFDAISVRESSAIKILEHLDIKDSIVVCDPVFLLDKMIWERLSRQVDTINLKDKYILIYDCESSKELRNIAVSLKAKTNLKIITISKPKVQRYWDCIDRLIGPCEFLYYIKNAEYVVTNSFHATAFSIIFERRFFVSRRSDGINSRMEDFLNYCKLSSRLISCSADIDLSNIDYTATSKAINKLVATSKQFLETNIAGVY